jgi:hypothetical protein
MKKTISTLILVAVVLSFFSGCSKKSNSTPATAGTTDGQTAMAIYSVFGTVFSQIQFSKTDAPDNNAITINQTITGPNGGTAVITGTVTVNQSTGQETWNLTVVWNEYKVITGNNNYTINGQMTYSGTVSSTSVTVQFSSTNLSIQGTFNGSSVNESISINYTVTVNNSHGSISGTVDGRSFSYSW